MQNLGFRQFYLFQTTLSEIQYERIKGGNQKSIKNPIKTLRRKFESSFTFGTFKLFLPKKKDFGLLYKYQPVEGAQHQKEK